MLRLDLEGLRVLFAGGIDAHAQFLLRGTDCRADVLRVPRQCMGPVSAPFVDAVGATHAVAAPRYFVGDPSRHTAQSADLAARGVRLWRIDREGAVRLVMKDGKAFLSGERARRGYPAYTREATLPVGARGG